MDYVFGALFPVEQAPLKNFLAQMVVGKLLGERSGGVFAMLMNLWMGLVVATWVVNHGMPFSVMKIEEKLRKKKKTGSELRTPKRKRS